ncbi:MAG: histidine--tRNA ligase family protein [Dehalococcoidia bacterium]|nr:histidine--tRNA ligase family protein [Dehalococcoidia bacterium]
MDLTAQEMQRFRSVEMAFLEMSKCFGYEEVRTPTLEYLHLFTSAGTLTQGMLRRVYSFLDWDGWSGERVVLKPDATIPVARLYVDRLQKMGNVARLCYVTNSFVFEETGTKSRERWQCGAELIGEGGELADAELISLACESVKRMGLTNIEIKLSHVGLIRGLLASLGIGQSDQDGVLGRILDGEENAFDGIQSDKPQSVDVLKLLFNTKGNSAGFVKNIRALFTEDDPDVADELNSFISIIEIVEAMGLPCQVDFTSGKGFEYYTGIIFRLYVDNVNVGGGGRYDKLIEMMGGTAAPAAGFALYIDRLSSRISVDNLALSSTERVSLKIVPDAVKLGTELADLLRRTGLIVVTSLGGQTYVDCGWEVEITSAQEFILTNLANKEKRSFKEAIDVVAELGIS